MIHQTFKKYVFVKVIDMNDETKFCWYAVRVQSLQVAIDLCIHLATEMGEDFNYFSCEYEQAKMLIPNIDSPEHDKHLLLQLRIFAMYNTFNQH